MYFKTSTSIIIPKPNKASHNTPKTFRPIVLLNILGKLIEKVISNKLQFQVLSKNIIHSCQLDRLKQCSMTNASIVLTHLIWVGWVKNCSTNTLTFDIIQFFLSLNHQMLLLILNKTGFDPKISHFFSNYLVGRKTKYLWNDFSSPFFDVNIGIGQGLVLSPILSVLYLSLVFYIFEKRLKKLKITVFVISFVHNSLFISQNKFFSYFELKSFL